MRVILRDPYTRLHCLYRLSRNAVVAIRMRFTPHNVALTLGIAATTSCCSFFIIATIFRSTRYGTMSTLRGYLVSALGRSSFAGLTPIVT